MKVSLVDCLRVDSERGLSERTAFWVNPELRAEVSIAWAFRYFVRPGLFQLSVCPAQGWFSFSLRGRVQRSSRRLGWRSRHRVSPRRCADREFRRTTPYVVFRPPNVDGATLCFKKKPISQLARLKEPASVGHPTKILRLALQRNSTHPKA